MEREKQHVMRIEREREREEEGRGSGRERADTDLEFSFTFSMVVLTYLFGVRVVSTAARLPWDRFSELPQKRGKGRANFCLITSSWLVFNCRLYLVASLSRLTFKLEPSFYFSWCRREDISVSSSFTPVQKIRDRAIFNYRSHSPIVIGRPKTSALVWFLRGQLDIP